jgi:hypothetical protein
MQGIQICVCFFVFFQIQRISTKKRPPKQVTKVEPDETWVMDEDGWATRKKTKLDIPILTSTTAHSPNTVTNSLSPPSSPPSSPLLSSPTANATQKKNRDAASYSRSVERSLA